MARIATIAAGLALMVAQPVTTAWAQSSTDSGTEMNTQRSDGGSDPFFRGHPDRIVLALGALTAVVLGIATLSKGNNNNNGPRPTSP
jgi:hypothetical protein